jgi:tetratricopeptide (TPR) repeat protein
MAKALLLSGRHLLAVKILLFIAVGLWIYSPVFHGAWLMDDDLYLPNNPLRHDPAHWWKIWFAPGSFIEYYPIEATLQALQWQLWGHYTLGYHLTNVVLHILNALLVWRLLDKFKLKLAWLGGVLFLVHPTAVESVAWIAEFKNALSLAPFLIALCFWFDFEEHRERRDYLLALGLFLLAMLCKISMAPFPVVILLYAWWKRGRVDGRDLLNAAPFFLISIVLGATTLLAGQWFLQLHHTTPEIISMGGLFWRLDLVGLSAAYYFSEFFLPMAMDPMIPPWSIDPWSPRQFLPWVVLLGGAGWFWTKRKSWGRHALLGLGFFFLMLAPFLGFKEASYMKISFVFDHFLYLPGIGLIGLVVAALGDVDRQLLQPFRLMAIGVVTLLLGLCALESHAYAAIFSWPTIFYGYVVGLHPQSWADHNALGNVLRKEGRIAEAIQQFQAAAVLDPDQTAPLNNLGGVLFQSGRYAEAAETYEKAIALDPGYAEARTGLGNTWLLLGKLPQAIEQYEAALKIRPDSASTQNGLANAMLMSNRIPEAMTHAQEAVRLAPTYVDAHCTLGAILEKEGRIDEAIAQFEKAALYDPDNARVEQELASLREQQAGRK